MVGTGRKALDHKVQEPGEAGAHGTANTAQRDALAQQVFNQGALLVRNATVFGGRHELVLARFTLMILFAMVGMATFFLYRVDPYFGHASLTSIAAVGLPAFGSVFDQQ
jgi:hypothetical protein